MSKCVFFDTEVFQLADQVAYKLQHLVKYVTTLSEKNVFIFKKIHGRCTQLFISVKPYDVETFLALTINMDEHILMILIHKKHGNKF